VSMYRITFQVEAESPEAAIKKLQAEPQIWKYLVSLFSPKEEQKGGWGEGFKSQFWGSSKKK
jgi:hypothetical protein